MIVRLRLITLHHALLEARLHLPDVARQVSGVGGDPGQKDVRIDCDQGDEEQLGQGQLVHQVPSLSPSFA